MERTGLRVISNLLTALKTVEIMKLFGLKPETLLLLESVLKQGDDWDLDAENVKTQIEADCISKLIQLPFGYLMQGLAHRGGSLWENDGNLSIVKQGQVASYRSHSEETDNARML